MKALLTFFNSKFTEKYNFGVVNIPLLIIILLTLLAALSLCIVISKRHRLYVGKKEDKKENAYT